MTISFTKTFLTYRDADAWIEAHGYDGPVMDINEKTGVTVVLLQGETAQRAIENETNTRAIAEQDFLASTGAFPEDANP